MRERKKETKSQLNIEEIYAEGLRRQLILTADELHDAKKVAMIDVFNLGVLFSVKFNHQAIKRLINFAEEKLKKPLDKDHLYTKPFSIHLDKDVTFFHLNNDERPDLISLTKVIILMDNNILTQSY